MSVSSGNNKLLEQGIIIGAHASWPGPREGGTSCVSEVPMYLSGLLELQWSLQPGMSLLAGLRSP